MIKNMEDSINKLDKLIIKDNDRIHIDSTPAEALAMMELIMTGMVEEGLVHEDVDKTYIKKGNYPPFKYTPEYYSKYI